MATGSSNQGIADKLVITLRAVEKYVSSIFGKLGLPSTRSDHRRVLAVLTYLRSWREPPQRHAVNRPPGRMTPGLPIVLRSLRGRVGHEAQEDES